MIKNIKNFFYYKSVLKKIEKELDEKFSIRIDSIYRMYTIFSMLPKEFNIYGDELFEAELKKYIKKVDTFLNERGLKELYGLSNQERLDDLNYKIVIRYKYLNTLKIANTAIILSVMSILGIILFFLL